MGADLYIESIHDKVRAKYEPLFRDAVKRRNAAKSESKKEEIQKEVEKYYQLMNGEGYFRDSYNGSSVMWALGLSWWGDVKPNKKGQISPTAAKKLKKMILERELKVFTADELRANHLQVDEDGDGSVNGWNSYYKAKRERLLAFLDKAIELKEPITASL